MHKLRARLDLTSLLAVEGALLDAAEAQRDRVALQQICFLAAGEASVPYIPLRCLSVLRSSPILRCSGKALHILGEYR